MLLFVNRYFVISYIFHNYFWPRPRPQPPEIGLGLGLGLEVLASLTSLSINMSVGIRSHRGQNDDEHITKYSRPGRLVMKKEHSQLIILSPAKFRPLTEIHAFG